jgi:hypothetical protein
MPTRRLLGTPTTGGTLVLLHKQRTLVSRAYMGRGMQAYAQARVRTIYCYPHRGHASNAQYPQTAYRTVLAQLVTVPHGTHGLTLRIVPYPTGIAWAYPAANANYRT